MPTDSFIDTEVQMYNGALKTIIENAINTQRTPDSGITKEVLQLGWAGAAVWYNKVAQMNGAFIAAVMNVPTPSELPMLMKAAASAALMENEFMAGKQDFLKILSDSSGMNAVMEIQTEGDRDILTAMVLANNVWLENDGQAKGSSFKASTGNVFIDFVNGVLGTSGIFEMRSNTNVHPLAQITSLGKGMMEAVVRNAATGVAATAGKSILGVSMPSGSGEALFKTMGGFFFSMTMITMGMAFVLYYVVPLMPFIYFLFAVSGWIKSIFEAIVGMPLWALAHLRIDGEGLPGPGATNGYFLLMEIFIRPTLIIVGFVASISLFSALVSVLNQIFELVVGNAGGFDNELEALLQNDPTAAGGAKSFLDISRGPIDEFFYTAMYTITVYLIGISCFKLVDTIPNQIMRWAGVSTPSFQENAGDPAATLSSNIYRGALLTGNQVTGRFKGDFALIANG